MNRRGVDELRSLEAQDAELAGAADRLRELDATVAQIRERAEAIEAFLASYPKQRAALQAAVADAGRHVEQRETELERARAAAEAARDDETRARARLALARAEDHAAVAHAALERARAAAAELERDASLLPDELAALDRRAAEVAADVPHAAEPGNGATALVEWASVAHAELFVALGQLDANRDRVVREANELASMLLGEATYGATVTQALARVAGA